MSLETEGGDQTVNEDQSEQSGGERAEPSRFRCSDSRKLRIYTLYACLRLSGCLQSLTTHFFTTDSSTDCLSEGDVFENAHICHFSHNLCLEK